MCCCIYVASACDVCLLVAVDLLLRCCLCFLVLILCCCCVAVDVRCSCLLVYVACDVASDLCVWFACYVQLSLC